MKKMMDDDDDDDDSLYIYLFYLISNPKTHCFFLKQIINSLNLSFFIVLV